MSITNEVKKELVAKYGRSENDTGCPEVQIAIWTYRIKSSIILCGRWWRIIITHPLGVYFIVFPGITKQIYLNGYEGYRFFWWHKKTVIEKPYLL